MAIALVHEFLYNAAIGGVGISAFKVNSRQSMQPLLVGSDETAVENTCLNELGMHIFGRSSYALRQSAQIKSVVQKRLAAKQKRGRC